MIHLLRGQFNELFQQVNAFVELLSEEHLSLDPELNLRKKKEERRKTK